MCSRAVHACSYSLGNVQKGFISIGGIFSRDHKWTCLSRRPHRLVSWLESDIGLHHFRSLFVSVLEHELAIDWL